MGTWLQPITISHYLVLAAILFFIGVFGVLTRKNLFTVMMSVELMLNAVNLTLLAFAKQNATAANPTAIDLAHDAHILVFFIMAIAAAEAAVGLSIVVAMFRQRETVLLNELNSLSG